jgi:hypothetical protein
LSGSSLRWQMLISISSCFNNMFTLSKLMSRSCERRLLIVSHQLA